MICNICINDKTTKKLDSLDLCDECRKEHKKASATYYNVMLRDYPEKLIGRE